MTRLAPSRCFGGGVKLQPPQPPPVYAHTHNYVTLNSYHRFTVCSAPPNVGEPEVMSVATTGPLSKTIPQLHSNTLYRISVIAETGAGLGNLVFVDGKTLLAAREFIEYLH